MVPEQAISPLWGAEEPTIEPPTTAVPIAAALRDAATMLPSTCSVCNVPATVLCRSVAPVERPIRPKDLTWRLVNPGVAMLASPATIAARSPATVTPPRSLPEASIFPTFTRPSPPFAAAMIDNVVPVNAGFLSEMPVNWLPVPIDFS